MTTKHTPATPLPWDHNGQRIHYSIDSLKSGQRVAEIRNCKGPNGHDTGLDARYIAHTANAYPRLVEALRAFVGPQQGRTFMRNASAAVALLQELGENT